MVVEDINARAREEREILGIEGGTSKGKRLSAATTAYNTAEQPTEENLTQRQNRSDAPSGNVTSWLRGQESATQERPTQDSREPFTSTLIRPPPDFENTPKPKHN